VLDAFVAGGGTMIDTADIYSAWVPGNEGGESETILGEWLRGRDDRARIQVATKVGMLGDGGLRPERIAAACDASLRRLGVERIDLYYAHRDDPEVPLSDVAGAFARLVEAGKVRALGASNFSAARLAEARGAAAAAGLPGFGVLQPEYNLVERDYEGELQDYCAAEGVGVLPYFGLAAGFLTGKYRTEADLSRGSRGERAGRYLTGKGPAVLAAMDNVAADTGATLAQIALAWLLARPAVTAPIASATSAAQVEESLGATTLTLTAEQVEALTEAG
jgi:aryl-alcohol dehydrogenase-like predicted oxidoreductase